MTEPPLDEATTPSPIGIATYSEGAPALLAQRRGQLAIFRDCLVFGEESDRGLVVFRDADVSWDGHTLTYLGKDYAVGDEVNVGGGQTDLSRLEGLRLPPAWIGVTRAFVVAPVE